MIGSLNRNRNSGFVVICCLNSPSPSPHPLFTTAPGTDHRYCQHHQPATSTSGDQITNVVYQIVEEDKEQALDKLALVDYVNNDGQYDDKLCNVFRSGANIKCKVSTYGFLATFLSCGVIVGFTEQPCSEGSKCENSLFHLTNN